MLNELMETREKEHDAIVEALRARLEAKTSEVEHLKRLAHSQSEEIKELRHQLHKATRIRDGVLLRDEPPGACL